LDKRPIARIPAALLSNSQAVANKIEVSKETRLSESLSVRSIAINGNSREPVGILKVIDLGTFTILQISAKPPRAGKSLMDELRFLNQVHGWYAHSQEEETELLRVLKNPSTFASQGNQAWLALSSIGFVASSLSEIK
jgi:hypothetical protein